ncbi:hypothetical protein [Alteromonas sp. KUL49]|uniref:hypothetical protein n=1 Tax=Alteromonas sp. KUL49 TaxID=2480798 RepID=UPI00102F24C3|nr:hypothetical protein [Alteromonas sp. KUL49]TAP38609.1 hypothetical protein EYS00_14455 [Alteromonas sp. KUL49]GEA12546.1 hypothetical protein KUL49_29210 [Alteromonas sp. KUL49]
MENSNIHLKSLLLKTDIAFKALMQEPSSVELNEAYEQAKTELDTYMVSLRNSLTQRQKLR